MRFLSVWFWQIWRLVDQKAAYAALFTKLGEFEILTETKRRIVMSTDGLNKVLPVMDTLELLTGYDIPDTAQALAEKAINVAVQIGELDEPEDVPALVEAIIQVADKGAKDRLATEKPEKLGELSRRIAAVL